MRDLLGSGVEVGEPRLWWPPGPGWRVFYELGRALYDSFLS